MSEETTHFIGIGGIGMSALARLILQKNGKVTGSDQSNSALTDSLVGLGAKIVTGHSPVNLPVKGTVVISSGIQKENPELMSCDLERHRVIHRSILLEELMQDQKSLLVVGTHGKTTTSSLLATVLINANLDPSWAVGGIVSPFGVNSSIGTGEYFVAEADESDGTHVNYTPYGAILTNLNEDHLDYYQTKEALSHSFKEFILKVKSNSHLFWCFDSLGLRELSPMGLSYGFSDGADLQISRFHQSEKFSTFDLRWGDKSFKEIEIPLLGKHNALNAAAVFGLALTLGIDEEKIRQGIKVFGGAKRRLDIKSDQRQVLVLDDYAHHPNEITATLTAIKEAYPGRRLVVLFQPHRFTRTRDCFKGFVNALSLADVLFLTDIYSAGETAIEGISSLALLNSLPNGRYVPRGTLTYEAAKFIRPFDVVVTMGAGDITKVSDELSLFCPKKLKIACIFGGKSKEHEVSFLSARSITSSFDEELFDIEYFAISKKGGWINGSEAKRFLFEEASFEKGDLFSSTVFEELKKCDLAFPILHGTNGEDGIVQGFFETLGLPYVGCNVESSSISMNKAISKKIALAESIPTAPFVCFSYSEWEMAKDQLLLEIKNELTYPLFVKPVHLGSTVGIKKVKDEVELLKAIDFAFSFDIQILVENGVMGREIECAILGRGPWFISNPGEIDAKGQVYEYEGKYGENAIEALVEAPLSEEEIIAAKAMALKIYRSIGCDGMARVDLFLTAEGYLFNEVNPIPGFTKNSLYPKMCESSGLSYTALLTELSELALSRKVKQDQIG